MGKLIRYDLERCEATDVIDSAGSFSRASGG